MQKSQQQDVNGRLQCTIQKFSLMPCRHVEINNCFGRRFNRCIHNGKCLVYTKEYSIAVRKAIAAINLVERIV